MMAEAAAVYLTASGLGTFDAAGGGSLRVAFQPDDPDDVVTLFDESAPTITESSAHAIDRLGVQVLVRSKDYTAARTKAFDIHKQLAGFAGELAAGFPRVTLTEVITAPTSIGQDEKNRSEFSGHYAFLIQSTGDQWRER